MGGERRGTVVTEPTRPTRRAMLAAAVAGSLGLAGCKGIALLGPVPNPSLDVVTLEHAIAAEAVLVATYLAAASQLSGSGSADARTQRLSAVVAAIQAEHQAHLTRLRARLVLPPRLARSKPRPVKPSPLPPDSPGLIGALVASERAATARLTRQLLDAPPALAQLMAAIAASEAAHVVYLRKAGSA